MLVTDQAFVTLATNDVYCRGALVLCQSLRNHKTTRRIVALFTPQVSRNMRSVLERLFDEVIEVNVLDSGDTAHLALLTRPELGVTFTKIHCWCLVQYSKCVFMDADTLVCNNIDDLFEREELSAAPDPGWPDCFNTGVFVYRPSIETYDKLLQFATDNGSFDGGDQGLLNSFFSSWSTKDIQKHLPFIYNLSGIAIYSYLPAFKQFGSSVKVVHFLGPTKPWHHKYDAQTKSVVQENMSPSDSMFMDFLNLWWDIFTTSILPLLVEHGVVDKSADHQMHQAGDLQVIMKRQEEAVAQEKANMVLEQKAYTRGAEPVIVRQHGYFYVPRPEPVPTSIPKIFIQLPHLGRPLEPQKSIFVRRLNMPISADTSLSSMKMVHRKEKLFLGTQLQFKKHHAVTLKPAANLTTGIIRPRKSALKTRKETVRPGPSVSPKQHYFAYKRTDNVRPQTMPLTAEPPTSSMEMVHDMEMLPPPVIPEPGTQEDVATSLADLSLEVEPMQSLQTEERRRWEEGNVDYLGRDAFENIQKKLDRFLK
ncbi:glycogenin-1-like isoform X4 [Scyliorhinus canicula]|uniref:glycogenin-1-like isoform X4 n=1 Tax=Scyliorhinus canicula TaxID=7830 RepID=UPI0018F37485|nr:glycogenin-1-like isoform X4 [Scyliorhinus canicula]